jgi:S1-C subfamily serine protease
VAADIATSKAAPLLGVVVGPGLRVLDVERGTSAEEIGIRAGDVVTKVGGATASTPADAKRSFRQAKGGDRLSVTVRRGGQDLVLSFVVRGVISREGIRSHRRRRPSRRTTTIFERR